MSKVYTSIKNPAMIIAKLIDNGKMVELLLTEWVWEHLLFKSFSTCKLEGYTNYKVK